MVRPRLKANALALTSLIALVFASLHVHVEEVSRTDTGRPRAAADNPPVDPPIGVRSPDPNAPTEVSSDDAHHEHSSRAHLALEVCFACGSKKEREAAPTRTQVALHAAAPNGIALASAPLVRAAAFRGRPASRAPPIRA